ncbi:FKBP-type peptidyl-prolyl cis-trans isomerase [Mucilaginibacter galii]|uniref:Peptidyl-prolyl cis-trans isomerase n=1 Tax=Mucilaginibacter galii TaxID=2005073 RepID=A0A917J5C8_9SPHI|nr:FKBP-type peptidyl-prolyl cis-trans isomerase [Mucilaginibacter galii]GGI49495.1 hypothetical protein GCM10011425_07070 [Mucilaginibacter galii]
MKQSYLALFFLTVLGLCSCRKDGNDIGIKEYDQNQIDAYIKANNLTGMQRDKAGNVDTTGIYYQIFNQGKGEALDYDKRVSLVYTVKSLDGKYAITDTFVNRNYYYVGAATPKGLMLALHNLAKTKGTQGRFLIPSHLAYGSAGTGVGSSRLPGNESLDFTVSVLNDADIDKYDDAAIQKYLTANNLTGYQKVVSSKFPQSSLYRQITLVGTGTVPAIQTSTVNVQYTGKLFNNTIFDEFNDQETGNVGKPLGLENGVIQGWKDGLIGVVAGSKVSLIIPSRLAYGFSANVNPTTGATVIPATSCLRFDMNVLTVTN